jgi:hypothetical protein
MNAIAGNGLSALYRSLVQAGEVRVGARNEVSESTTSGALPQPPIPPVRRRTNRVARLVYSPGRSLRLQLGRRAGERWRDEHCHHVEPT